MLGRIKVLAPLLTGAAFIFREREVTMEGVGEGVSREDIAAEAGDGGRSAGAEPGAPALPRIVRNKGRLVQVAPTTRKLFDKGARRVFLEWFAGTGNLSLSARKAGFHYRTVLRHRAEDDLFRGEFDLALEQSEVRVQAWLAEAKDAGLDLSEASGFDPSGPDEMDGHAPANLTPEMAMQWLRANGQRKAHAAAAAAGGGGGAGLKRGRAPSAASNEEVLAALLKGMRAMQSHRSGTSMGARKEASDRDGASVGSGGEEEAGSAPPPEREAGL
jgi:hypothetical protein